MTDFLSIAADAFDSSTSYMDANWRKQWEDSLALFQSRHPAGSKYNSDEFKHRSRLFRPKTRSVTRKNEAAAAAAFFSNVDVVSIEPENQADPIQQAAAELMGQLVNYRLQKSIPWFQIVIGALQDAQVYGVVTTYQYWKYKEKVSQSEEPIVDDLGRPILDEMGQPYMRPVESAEVIEDKPCIELIPPENIRFDPGAGWLDPVGTSPYVIRMVPMYVGDVKTMMEQTDTKTGQPKWKELSDGEIRQAKAAYDSLRQGCETPRADPKADNNAPLSDFEIVWCHENFVRVRGEEYVYWTMGTQHMLTDPVPLAEVYHTGKRPITIGTCVIEAHRVMPDSYVKLGEHLQREANDVVNQRMDNVKLVLNKRYITKRGKSVDIQSLLRNVPGSVTQADDPVGDVREISFPDVTTSAYAEQDRINVDFDELLGNFSAGSVQTNRQLNETVGGMGMLRGSASQLTEYLLLTFVETWMEKVLRSLVKLEQMYESDVTVLGLAGEKAQLQQKYGIDQITDDLLNQELTVRVAVGMGATSPQEKLQKFNAALGMYSQALQTMPDADPEALRKEIFGLAGYRDGSRFFKKPDDNPEAQQEQAEAAEMQKRMALADLQAKELANAKLAKEIEAPVADPAASAELERVKAEFQMEIERFKAEAKAQLEREIAEARVQLEREVAAGRLTIEENRNVASADR